MIKRYKVRYEGTAITTPWLECKLGDNPTAEEQQESATALFSALRKFTPQGAIARWRPLAEELGVGGDLLDEAEKWIDKDNLRFEHFFLQAKTKIAGASNEKDIIPLAGKGAQFGPKDERLDALAQLMVEAAAAFQDEHGREPAALELWEALPLGPVLQEKEDEDTLFWRSRTGEKATSFKAFQNRLSHLRRKGRI